MTWNDRLLFHSIQTTLNVYNCYNVSCCSFSAKCNLFEIVPYPLAIIMNNVAVHDASSAQYSDPREERNNCIFNSIDYISGAIQSITKAAREFTWKLGLSIFGMWKNNRRKHILHRLCFDKILRCYWVDRIDTWYRNSARLLVSLLRQQDSFRSPFYLSILTVAVISKEA